MSSSRLLFFCMTYPRSGRTECIILWSLLEGLVTPKENVTATNTRALLIPYPTKKSNPTKHTPPSPL
ncbi:MAG TPA: hypothetical protein DCE42_05600 [Myxococcales bacterium]|nr:hypothetical protein [Myxococcales bacterium]